MKSFFFFNLINQVKNILLPANIRSCRNDAPHTIWIGLYMGSNLFKVWILDKHSKLIANLSLKNHCSKTHFPILIMFSYNRFTTTRKFYVINFYHLFYRIYSTYKTFPCTNFWKKWKWWLAVKSLLSSKLKKIRPCLK